MDHECRTRVVADVQEAVAISEILSGSVVVNSLVATSSMEAAQGFMNWLAVVPGVAFTSLEDYYGATTVELSRTRAFIPPPPPANSASREVPFAMNGPVGIGSAGVVAFLATLITFWFCLKCCKRRLVCQANDPRMFPLQIGPLHSEQKPEEAPM